MSIPREGQTCRPGADPGPGPPWPWPRSWRRCTCYTATYCSTIVTVAHCSAACGPGRCAILPLPLMSAVMEVLDQLIDVDVVEDACDARTNARSWHSIMSFYVDFMYKCQSILLASKDALGDIILFYSGFFHCFSNCQSTLLARKCCWHYFIFIYIFIYIFILKSLWVRKFLRISGILIHYKP